MQNLKKTVQNNTINTIYVFSKNNQVFVRKHSNTETFKSNGIKCDEWFPTNFQWEII